MIQNPLYPLYLFYPFNYLHMAITQKKSGAGFYIALVIGIFFIILLGAASIFMKVRQGTDTFFGRSGMMTVTSSPMAYDIAVGESGADSFGAPAMMNAKTSSYYPVPPQTAGDTAAVAEPRIIKTGSLNLEVESARDTAGKVADVATSRSGFVDNSNIVENQNGVTTGYVTVRVPSEKFDESMTAIRTLAIRVSSESTDGQDVTEQYTDLEARLKSAQAEEAQYLLILQKATSVEDILSVQSYLSNVRSQIESLQGQIKYLGNKTDYSTISVSLSEQAQLQIPSQKFDLGRDARLAAHAVILLAQAFITFFVWFLIVGGAIIIPTALIFYVIYRVIRHFVKK